MRIKASMGVTTSVTAVTCTIRQKAVAPNPSYTAGRAIVGDMIFGDLPIEGHA